MFVRRNGVAPRRALVSVLVGAILGTFAVPLVGIGVAWAANFGITMPAQQPSDPVPNGTPATYTGIKVTVNPGFYGKYVMINSNTTLPTGDTFTVTSSNCQLAVSGGMLFNAQITGPTSVTGFTLSGQSYTDSACTTGHANLGIGTGTGNYDVTPTQVTGVTFTGSSYQAGATGTTWAEDFTPTVGLTGADTITVTFNPAFTGIPATPTVTLPSGFTNCTVSNATAAGGVVSIQLAGATCSLSAGTQGEVDIAGVTNPPAADYANTSFSVKTSQDNGPANPSSDVVILGNTITASPTSDTISYGNNGSAYSNTLTPAGNADGPVTFSQTGGSDVVNPPNYDVNVGTSGAVSAPATLPASVTPYTASGTMGDPDGDTGNFNFSLTVNPADITVNAVTTTVALGAAVPDLTPGVVGLQNGDPASDLGITCQTTYTPGSSVAGGPYPVTCSGGTDDSNYDVTTWNDGSITVTAGTVAVNAVTTTVNYGDPIPDLTPSISASYGSPSASDLGVTCTTSYVPGSSVAGGPYPVTCSVTGTEDPSYGPPTFTDGSITVDPIAATVTPLTTTVTYGDPAPDVSSPDIATAYGTPSAADLDVICSTGYAQGSSVAGGPYAVTCSSDGLGDSNYTVDTTADGSITVDPLSVDVTALTTTVNYGDPAPDLTPGVSASYGSPSASSLDITCSTGYAAGSSVAGGPYAVTCSSDGEGDSNYSVGEIADGSITVDPLDVSVNAISATVTYGDPVPDLTPSVDSTYGSPSASDLGVTCSTTYHQGSGVGNSPYPVTCSVTGEGDGNYNVTEFVDGSITVGALAVNVTAPSATVHFGAGVPNLTPTVEAVYGSPTASDLGVTCSTTYTHTSSVAGSPYPVTCSGGDSDVNYDVTLVDGSITVTKAQVTVTAPSPTVTYGSAVPTLTPTATGLQGTDTVGSLGVTCTTTYTHTSSVAGGPYPVHCTGGTSDPNYSVISFVDGSLTVTKAQVTVTAPSTSVTYGSAVPSLTPSVSGLVNGDSVSSLGITCSTTYTHTSNAGHSYPVTCAGGTGNGNYTVTTWTDGSITVTPAHVSVTAPSTSVTYGSAVPNLTPSVSGLLNGDPASGLGITCSTTYTHTSNAGHSYPVTCSGGTSDGNYSVTTWNDGSITVTAAHASVTAVTTSVTYGDPVPDLTPSVSGLLNGDPASDLGVTCSTTYTVGAGVNQGTDDGAYPVTCAVTGEADSNYNVTFTSGDITVNPAEVNVTGPSTTVNYDDPVPDPLTPSISGILGEDSPDSLGVTCTTTYWQGAGVNQGDSEDGTYSVSCAGGTDNPNYTVNNWYDGWITVDPVPLTITASGGTQYFGQAAPAIMASYAGFVNDEAPSDLNTEPTCTSNTDNLSPVGTYNSTCSGAVDENYTFTYVPGIVTVLSSSSTTTVTENHNPVVTGESVTFTASVAVASGSPTGSVTFTSDDGRTLCTAAPLNNGTATCTTSFNQSSLFHLYTVTATYSGDNNFVGSSGSITIRVYSYGYWLAAADGGIFSFGAAAFYGSTGNLKLQRPVVGMDATDDRGGYWMVAGDGGMFAFGDARFHGSIPGLGIHPAGSGFAHELNQPVVAVVASPTGQGYLLVASDGGVFAFGNDLFWGSCPALAGGCSGPVVSVVPDAGELGYWVITATGHVYPFGNAASVATGEHLNPPAPITGGAPTLTGLGYYMVDAKGDVYGFGDAKVLGNPPPNITLASKIVAIVPTATGAGYWLMGADGAVYTYGDAPNDGSMAGKHLNDPIITATGS